jgi:hypothetical protein
MFKCPSCGLMCKDTWKWCEHCAQPLPKEKTTTAPPLMPEPKGPVQAFEQERELTVRPETRDLAPMQILPWTKRKGPLQKLRLAYLKDRTAQGLTMVIDPVPDVLCPPVELVLEPLSMVSSYRFKGERLHVQILPFLRYCPQALREHLPDRPLLDTTDIDGLLRMAYWGDRSGNLCMGAPKDLLETASGKLPSLKDLGPHGMLSSSPLEQYAKVATALSDLLGDHEGARLLLEQAEAALVPMNSKEFNGFSYDIIFDGPSYLAVARGYLEALGDTSVAGRLANQLREGMGNGKTYLGLAQLLLEMGELERAKGLMGSLLRRADVSQRDGIPISMPDSGWQQLSLMYLDVDDTKMANLALWRPEQLGMGKETDPPFNMTAPEIATKSFDRNL